MDIGGTGYGREGITGTMDIGAGNVTGKRLEFSCLIRHPYHALKNMGVENVYLLYGNCPPCSLDAVQNARKGNYFELADAEDLETIKIMEREYIPVVKAGCIIENKWVFYFSAYGMDVMELYQFTRRYYTKEGYDRALRHPEIHSIRRACNGY